jgi:chaperonin GroEL (HSP60 family)
MVVRRAMKFSAIVAGGGAIEMELSRLLINIFLFKDI